MQPFSGAVLALLAATSLFAAGCSTFNRDWKKAAATPAGNTLLEGRWEGSWRSDVNGHTDRLRCLITKLDQGLYQARFHAKYRKIFSFGYTVPLRAENTNGQVHFSGEADLGSLAGGLYKYEGHAEATNFFSTYTCKYDHGTFQMGRPLPTKH